MDVTYLSTACWDLNDYINALHFFHMSMREVKNSLMLIEKIILDPITLFHFSDANVLQLFIIVFN